MIGKLITENNEFLIISILIIVIVNVIAALTFIKLRNYYKMKYKHCNLVILIIAAILYLISDGSNLFIFWAGFFVFVLRYVSDTIFVPHLVKRRVNPEYTKEAILHFIYTFAAFLIYIMLLVDNKHILDCVSIKITILFIPQMNLNTYLYMV